MPIKAIEPRRLYLQIADQVRALIASGEFSPGSRLPAERELAKQFGVSRPSMREALIALEVEGYVEVRPGSGILVNCPTPKGGGPDHSEEEGPLEVLRTRGLIEGAIAEQAAGTMKQKDISALKEILLAMEDEKKDLLARIAADRHFHQYIAAHLANKVLLRVVTELLEQRDSPLARQFAFHFDNAKTWNAVLAEHRAIVSALAARDPKRACQAMRGHLQKAFDRWVREPSRRAKAGFHDAPARLARDGLASVA